MRQSLAGLRRSLTKIQAEDRGGRGGGETFAPGLPGLASLPRGALHEVMAQPPSDCVAGDAFALGLALRASAGRPIVWIRQRMAARECGELYGGGLAAFGADPGRVIQVRTRSALEALRAGHEGLRCTALGAVVIEPFGTPRALDLTATLRLARAAARSGVTAFLLRAAVQASSAGIEQGAQWLSGTTAQTAPAEVALPPSAAFTRWSVRALPSVPLGANAPGAPAFEIDLVRHREGVASRRWCVEWDRDQLAFCEPPLSGAVAAVSADRPAQWRQAG